MIVVCIKDVAVMCGFPFVFILILLKESKLHFEFLKIQYLRRFAFEQHSGAGEWNSSGVAGEPSSYKICESWC